MYQQTTTSPCTRTHTHTHTSGVPSAWASDASAAESNNNEGTTCSKGGAKVDGHSCTMCLVGWLTGQNHRLQCGEETGKFGKYAARVCHAQPTEAVPTSPMLQCHWHNIAKSATLNRPESQEVNRACWLQCDGFGLERSTEKDPGWRLAYPVNYKSGTTRRYVCTNEQLSHSAHF